ncbi:MAG TPA: TRAM domain-containing protein [Phycisphaerae bacterium]|nr:TRAM domain-containing protein [Phycisphaerae bacterium]
MIKIARLVFLLLVSAVALIYGAAGPDYTTLVILGGGVVLAFLIIAADILVKKKNLALLSGVMFGLLVGILVSLGLGYLLQQLLNLLFSSAEMNQVLVDGVKFLLTLIVCYITISFILQTKDDFRFIIPYVEFKRATKGPRPIILDTSVIIDGRIADMCATGMFETTLIVPRFVLNELQAISDSSDRLKRSRGRRGLDVLEKLKGLPRLELRFWDGTLSSPSADAATADAVPAAPAEGVDQKLVLLAQQENARIMTNDFNLNKVATLRGITVININLIADALKPVILPGETMKVRIIKAGENPGQGVGYLEDGTMVVIEGGRDKVGAEVEVVVTNMIQNAAGKMIFGRTVPTKAA